jgi:DUF3006 family protein
MGNSYTIDRFEDGDWAVLEDDQGRTFSLPRRWLPAEAREGDVLKVDYQKAEPAVETLRLELDPAAREERLDRARQARNRLRRGPKGDFSL